MIKKISVLKKLSVVVAVIILASLISIPQTFAAAVLVNSDFEDGTLGPWAIDGGAGSAEITTEDSHSGDYSVKITKTEAYARLIYSSLPLVDGKVYVIEAWYKSLGANDQARITMNDPMASAGQHTYLTETPIGNEWTRVYSSFTRTDQNQIQIRTASANIGFYVDDIMLAEAAPSAVSVTSPVNTIVLGLEEQPINLQLTGMILNQIGTEEGVPEDASIIWSLEGTVPSGVTIDGTGLLKIQQTAPEGSLTVRATLDGDSSIYFDKELTLAFPQAPVAENVEINGEYVNGQVLTGSYTYFSENDSEEDGTSFRWLKSQTVDGQYQEIDGATDIEYTLTLDDIGYFIKFEVTPKCAVKPYTGLAVESDETPIIERDIISSIDASETKLSYTVGQTGQIIVSGKSQKYGIELDLTSSDLTYSNTGKSVVTVSSDGKITASGRGTADVTITLQNPDNTVIYDRITITVISTTSQGGGGGGSGGGGSYGGGGSVSYSVPAVTVPRPSPTPAVEIIPVVPVVKEIEPKLFKDTENHWAKTEIGIMAATGVVNGISEDAFEPDRQVNRAEFASIIARALKIADESYSPIYDDVISDNWYAKSVMSASKAGLINGANNLFRPLDPLTREEMAKIIVEAYKISYSSPQAAAVRISIAKGSSSSLRFKDKDSISPWALEYVSIAYGLNLIKGVNDTDYAPKEAVTRAAAVVLIKRLLDNLKVEDSLKVSSTSPGAAPSTAAPTTAATPAPSVSSGSEQGGETLFSFESEPLGFELDGATVSTEQAHSGTKSVKFDSDAVNVSRAVDIKDVIVTIWFYDSLLENTNTKVLARVDDGTTWRAIGVTTETSTDYYVIRDSSDYEAPLIVTETKRTKGWHKFTWDFTSGKGVDYYIDDVKVGSTDGSVAIKQIAVVDFWANESISNIFIDDIFISDSGGAASSEASSAGAVAMPATATPAPVATTAPSSPSGSEQTRANIFSFESEPLGFELDGAVVSTEQAHSGTKSIKFTSDSVNVSRAVDLKDAVVTMWFYDSLLANTNTKVLARVDDGNTWRAIGVTTETSTDYYVIRDSSDYEAPLIVTETKRTKGWHKFTWDFTSGKGVDYYIDDVKVGSTDGSVAIKQIAVVDFWANESISNIFIDDISISDKLE